MPVFCCTVHSGVSRSDTTATVPGHVQTDSQWRGDLHGGHEERLQPPTYHSQEIWSQGRVWAVIPRGLAWGKTVGLWTDQCDGGQFLEISHWGIADVEMKVPSAENRKLPQFSSCNHPAPPPCINLGWDWGFIGITLSVWPSVCLSLVSVCLSVVLSICRIVSGWYLLSCSTIL